MMSDTDLAPATASFGYDEVPLDRKQRLVDTVFDRVADRYDLMNDLMSAGLHRVWKAAMVAELGLPRGARLFRLLDVAGGTGDIAFRALARGGPGVHVTLSDINGPMLEVGRARAIDRGLAQRIEVVQGNAETLPFADRRFDAVSIAFGLRNVPRTEAALAEIRRVLKPGGRFLCLEFSPRLHTPGLAAVYDAYSERVIPELGRLVAGDPQPYRYLVESIRRFLDPEDLALLMRGVGFDRVTWRPFTGGVAALHAGWRL